MAEWRVRQVFGASRRTKCGPFVSTDGTLANSIVATELFRSIAVAIFGDSAEVLLASLLLLLSEVICAGVDLFWSRPQHVWHALNVTTARQLLLRLRWPAVDLAPMPHMQHVDLTIVDIYAVDNSIVAHANSAKTSPRSPQGRP